MAAAGLIIYSPGEDQREVELSGDASIGRAFDNTICLRDTGASRYHAIIEKRADGYWLKDLGSINGTTVNGTPITLDYKLQEGDSFMVGGKSRIEYRCYDRPVEQQSSDPVSAGASIPTGGQSGGTADGPQKAVSQGPSPLKIVLSIAGALVVIGLAAVVLSFLFKPSRGAVRLASPRSGTVVRGPVTVHVDAENTKSIGRVLYQIDGLEVGSAGAPPYDISLDPADLGTRLPGLGVGSHVLSATVENKEGVQERQPGTVLLSFDTGGGATSDGSASAITPSGGTEGGSTSGPGSGSVSQGVDLLGFGRMLAGTISSKNWYIFDPEFVSQINSRTGDYRTGVVDDARPYRRDVNSAFSSRGVPVQLGFIMAISQSKFKSSAGSNGQDTIGFWRVPKKVAIEQGYIKADEAPSALNESRRSADLGALYMKDLLNQFGADDFMYAVACWGMPMAQAGDIKGKLEKADPNGTARRDFWKMVKSGIVPPEAADRVARFFAAGIVADNPRAFGLSQDPLSSLY